MKSTDPNMSQRIKYRCVRVSSVFKHPENRGKYMTDDFCSLSLLQGSVQQQLNTVAYANTGLMIFFVFGLFPLKINNIISRNNRITNNCSRDYYIMSYGYRFKTQRLLRHIFQIFNFECQRLLSRRNNYNPVFLLTCTSFLKLIVNNAQYAPCTLSHFIQSQFLYNLWDP